MVLPVDVVNFHLAMCGVKLHTQCTSNNFVETDVYVYAQWSTEILREAHLLGDWCAKQSVYKHQPDVTSASRTTAAPDGCVFNGNAAALDAEGQVPPEQSQKLVQHQFLCQSHACRLLFLAYAVRCLILGML